MGKLGYGLLIGIFLIGALILIPNSPIHPLAAHYAQKKMESHWNCTVIEKRLSANPITGRLSLEDLSIKTPESVNPTWHLKIRSATLHIRYLALIRENVIERLTLDGLVFKQVHKKTAEIPPEKDPPPAAPPHPSEPDTSPPDGPGIPEGLRIKHLAIRNGSFEYIRMEPSGVKHRIAADRISVVRKNVILDKRPDALFQSILNTDTHFERLEFSPPAPSE